MSVPPGVEARWKASPGEARQMKFFPNFFLRELMAWYIALGVLGALAAILALGTGNESGSVCGGSRWHSPGVVFHVHVPDAEDDSGEVVVCRWRGSGNPRFRHRRDFCGCCCRFSNK